MRIGELEKLLRLREIMEITSLSRAQIYRLQTAGRFPMRIKLGQRSAWVSSEVATFVAKRIEARERSDDVE
jgi:prophage regulatory protein